MPKVKRGREGSGDKMSPVEIILKNDKLFISVVIKNISI